MMMQGDIDLAKLTLLWLSRQEWSWRSECDERTVVSLIHDGLVKVRSRSPARIALSAMGWAAVARIQERNRDAREGQHHDRFRRADDVAQSCH